MEGDSGVDGGYLRADSAPATSVNVKTLFRGLLNHWGMQLVRPMRIRRMLGRVVYLRVRSTAAAFVIILTPSSDIASR